MQERTHVRIGVCGPVGCGKTALLEKLSRKLYGEYDLAVITNDIFCQEDAEFMAKNSLLPEERIIGVETGGCPHTAIREDASMNIEAAEELADRFPSLDFMLIESGGDNLAATYSPDLADVTIFIIDVAEGQDIPRKGGPGITRSDLLVINKMDLAPYVGVDLEIMEQDTRRMRNGAPFIFTNLKKEEGVDAVIDWIKKYALLEDIEDNPKMLR